ncbi:MAG: hypothetical protein ABIP96_03340 [Patescibacteria group bacterium]
MNNPSPIPSVAPMSEDRQVESESCCLINITQHPERPEHRIEADPREIIWLLRELRRLRESEKAKDAAIEDAFVEGFFASGEGFNGEYPPPSPDAIRRNLARPYIAAALAPAKSEVSK